MAQQLPHAERVEQDDWLVPHRDPWVAALEQLVLSRPEPVVLAAHSLGCITAAHLGPEASARVRGALLVAPADPERRAQLADFAPVPYAPLPYRSVLVASSNDPYCPIRRAGAYARAWGSEFVRLQNAGHINVESGFGDWPWAWRCCSRLCRATAGSRPSPGLPCVRRARRVRHVWRLRMPPSLRALALARHGLPACDGPAGDCGQGRFFIW